MNLSVLSAVSVYSLYFGLDIYHPGNWLFSLVCRFQAQDLEVQLSDELAGSMRQLKVRHKLMLPILTPFLNINDILVLWLAGFSHINRERGGGDIEILQHSCYWPLYFLCIVDQCDYPRDCDLTVHLTQNVFLPFL